MPKSSRYGYFYGIRKKLNDRLVLIIVCLALSELFAHHVKRPSTGSKLGYLRSREIDLGASWRWHNFHRNGFPGFVVFPHEYDGLTAFERFTIPGESGRAAEGKG